MWGRSSSSPKAYKPGVAVASAMMEAAARPREERASAKNPSSFWPLIWEVSMGH